MIAAATSLTNFAAFRGADPSAQLAQLTSYPVLAATVFWTTLKQSWSDYVTGFIGVLGWLDTALPKVYYAAAGIMLAVAAVTVMLGTKVSRHETNPAGERRVCDIETM